MLFRSFVATGKSAEALPEIEKAIGAAFADLQAGKIDADALSRIQSNRRNALLLGLDDPEKVAEQLALRLSLPWEAADETLTTAAARRTLTEVGARHQKRSGALDQMAAALILQGWLDRRRALAALALRDAGG